MCWLLYGFIDAEKRSCLKRLDIIGVESVSAEPFFKYPAYILESGIVFSNQFQIFLYGIPYLIPIFIDLSFDEIPYLIFNINFIGAYSFLYSFLHSHGSRQELYDRISIIDIEFDSSACILW